MTTENFGGNSSTNTTITKPQNTTTTTQSNKSTTQTAIQTSTKNTPPSVAEKELNQKGITAVNDDFLRGFNEGYEDKTSTTSYTPEPTEFQVARSSTWDDSRKMLSHKGITETIMDPGAWNPSPVLQDHIQSIPVRQKIEPISQTFVDVHKLADSHSNTGNSEQLSYETQKEQLKKAAEEEQAKLMDPHNQYYQTSSLPDSPIVQYIYYLQNLLQSPKQVEYEQFIANELKAENQAAQTEIRNWARENGVGASVVSLLTSPLKGVEYFNGVMETAVSGHRRPNSVPSFTETTNVIRDEVGENIAEKYGEGGRFVYNTVMSGADTVIAGLSGNVSGAIILGTGTASDTANDIMERGGSEEDALIGGAVSGILEGIFERFSLSQLEAMKLLPVSTAKDVVSNIAKSVVTNAGEEFSTELANTIFDTIFMGELSTYALTVQGYMSQGKSEADARRLAGQDILKRLGESALSGALMGVLFGGGASASSYYRSQLAAQGEAKLRAKEMPTPRELEALNASEPEALGAMVMLNLDQYFDDATGGHQISSVHEDSPVNVDLKYKKGWTDAQKAEADAKVKALTEAKTVKTPVNRRGTSASARYKSVYGVSSVPPGYDVDHTVDLQLGGADDISNLKPLEKSVNRSLGKQVGNAIKRYPYETEFGEFTIH